MVNRCSGHVIMLPSTDTWRSELVLIRVYGIRKPSGVLVLFSTYILTKILVKIFFRKRLLDPYPVSLPHRLSLLPHFSCLVLLHRPPRLEAAVVYKLMPNRSLQEALLDWKKRFDVVLDVALGLEYLHHVCDSPVIHGDVKPSNVLLDSEFPMPRLEILDWRC